MTWLIVLLALTYCIYKTPHIAMPPHGSDGALQEIERLADHRAFDGPKLSLYGAASALATVFLYVGDWIELKKSAGVFVVILFFTLSATNYVNFHMLDITTFGVRRGILRLRGDDGWVSEQLLHRPPDFRDRYILNAF